MAKKIDFSQNLKEELTMNKVEDTNNNITNNNISSSHFSIKKSNIKKEKTSFPVYIEKDKLTALNKIAEKNQISRNELINQFIDYILENN